MDVCEREWGWIVFEPETHNFYTYIFIRLYLSSMYTKPLNYTGSMWKVGNGILLEAKMQKWVYFCFIEE